MASLDVKRNNWNIEVNPIRKVDAIEKNIEKLRCIEDVDSEEIFKYHEEVLNELIEFVYENNKFYHDKIENAGYSKSKIMTKDIFEKIEFTTKEELRSEPYIALCVPKDKVAQVHISTGTTGGENIYILYTMFDLYGGDFLPQMRKMFPLSEGDVITIALPYEMSSSGQSFHRVAQVNYHSIVIPAGKGGAYSDPEKTIKFMKDMQCNILITTPSYAMELFKTAKALNINFEDHLKMDTIWLTGEGCSEAFRKRVEKQWGCNAKFYYGSLECGVLGIECDEKSGYHVSEGHVYLEIIDPITGKVLEDGQVGEIVVTTLLREGTPLIRYRTQDLGYFDSSLCSCGVKHKRLLLRGRAADQIKVGGKTYAPLYIEQVLMSLDEVGNDYKFNIFDDFIEIITEVDDKYRGIEGIDEIISSKVKNGCGVNNKVTIVDSIMYGGKKTRRVNYMNN